ncbi:MAG: ABC transporter substrate-binding protein [Deltaproteobacteria bacterium]
MKKARLSLVVMAVTALVLAACLGPSVAAGVPGVTDKTVTIGGPMLITGPIAVLGTAAADGLAIYWKWVNDEGGVHGRKVKCLMVDDGYNPTRAVAAARKLITRDNVFGFLTTSGTPQTLQLMPILEKEHVPALSGIVPSFPGIMKTLPDMFTFGMPYGDQIVLGIDYFIKDQKKKQPTLGIIYQDDAYGKEVKRGMDLAGMKQLRKVYKKYRPDIKDIQHYHILGYLNSLIFNEALERSGRNLTRPGWIKAMESIKDFYTGGLTGAISFGPNMHSSKCQGRVFKADLEKKRWVPVTDYRLPSVQ